MGPLYLALMATLSFSFASTIFTEFARRVGPFWMNSFKAIVALFAFIITTSVFHLWRLPAPQTTLALLLSGAIGLMIGDIFMLKAMAEIGASRMLMIFGLQPFFLGIGGLFFFKQNFSLINILGLLCMSACLYIIALEHYKKNGHWQWQGLLYGLIAILLDAVGILLTRFGFEQTKGISPVEVNAIRCMGAVAGLIVIYFFKYRIPLLEPWKKFTALDKKKILIASLAGTFISLMLYLTAISRGKLSVVSSVTVTGPMFAGLFECIKYKRLPTFYLFISFLFFISGFIIFCTLV